jgi:hypothetical protein
VVTEADLTQEPDRQDELASAQQGAIPLLTYCWVSA